MITSPGLATTGFRRAAVNFLETCCAGRSLEITWNQMPKRLPDMRRRFTQQSGNPAAGRSGRQAAVADQAAWQGASDRLGISALKSSAPDPTQIATEGALWGQRQGAWACLATPVIVKRRLPAQFNVGQHASIAGPRRTLVHNSTTFTAQAPPRQQQQRKLIWRYYDALKAYCRGIPTLNAGLSCEPASTAIFGRRTGFALLEQAAWARFAQCARESESRTADGARPSRGFRSTPTVRKRHSVPGPKRQGRSGHAAISAADCPRHIPCPLVISSVLFLDYSGDRLNISTHKPRVPHLAQIVRNAAKFESKQ